MDDEILEARTIIELLSLCEDTPQLEASIPTEGEHAVTMAISRLVPYLYDCDVKELSEAHLTSSYIYHLEWSLINKKVNQSCTLCGIRAYLCRDRKT